MNTQKISAFTDFEFDLPKSLLEKLVITIDNLIPSPLNLINVSNIPDEQGVYQLFLDNDLVYIGKTDGEAGLRKRLTRHYNKLQHRIGLDINQITFKAVKIYVFTAIDLETQLIKHYGGVKSVKWNGTGFGSNDPGKSRDGTVYKKDHFDAQYPINVDIDVSLDTTEKSVADILTEIKHSIPYTFRFETNNRLPHGDLSNTKITPKQNNTLRSIMNDIVDMLPLGWQCTALPSHVIFYKNDEVYPSGILIAKN